MNEQISGGTRRGIRLAALIVAVGVMVAVFSRNNPFGSRFREMEYMGHNLQGNRLLERGDIQGSIAEYTAMMPLFPNRPGPYMLRGIAYDTEDRHRNAIQDYTDGLARTADCTAPCAVETDATFHFDRGRDYELQGKNALAVADLTAALQELANMRDAHQVRAEAYLGLHQTRAAIQDCDWELQHRPSSPSTTYFIRGKANAEAGNYRAAALDLENATAQTDARSVLWTYRGWFEFKAGMLGQAIATDKRALVLDSADAACAFNLGLCYVMTGDEVNAHSAYTTALGRPLASASIVGARQDIADALREKPNNPLLLEARSWIAE